MSTNSNMSDSGGYSLQPCLAISVTMPSAEPIPSSLICHFTLYTLHPDRFLNMMQAVDAPPPPPQDTVLEPSVPDELQASPKGGGDEAPAATSREEWRGPTVHHLPPICVKLRFPRDYPSSSPPEAQLSALWLTTADSAALQRGLAALWDEQASVDPVDSIHNTLDSIPYIR